jgi:hypothetical protein
MESAPPDKLTLISPINGGRTGFFSSFTGKIRPKFQWSNVTDASGIARYDLQISTNSSFTTTVAQLSISSQNVSASADSIAYTLPKGNALPPGNYYWRARAIDGAQNQAVWSDAQSFHAGFLPQWAAITIAALLVVLIGVLVYYFIVRRRFLYD